MHIAFIARYQIIGYVVLCNNAILVVVLWFGLDFFVDICCVNVILVVVL